MATRITTGSAGPRGLLDSAVTPRCWPTWSGPGSGPHPTETYRGAGLGVSSSGRRSHAANGRRPRSLSHSHRTRSHSAPSRCAQAHSSVRSLPVAMTLGPDYFDRLYDEHRDPWGFQSRWYEKRKRRLTMAALPSERYGSVFEPGCSIGVLTADLTARSDHVLAMDISARALLEARRRLPPAVEPCKGPYPQTGPHAHLISSSCPRSATTSTPATAGIWRNWP